MFQFTVSRTWAFTIKFIHLSYLARPPFIQKDIFFFGGTELCYFQGCCTYESLCPLTFI